MGDFDAWLSSAVSKASEVGKTKRKLFYGDKDKEREAEQKKFDKVHGTAATPYGPEYEKQKLVNIGKNQEATIAAGPHLAKVALDEKQGNPQVKLLQSQVDKDAKETNVAKIRTDINIEGAKSDRKLLTGVLEKSAAAQTTVAQLEPVNPGWFTKVSNFLSPDMINKADVALERQGLSRDDIKTPAERQAIIGMGKKKKTDLRILEAGR